MSGSSPFTNKNGVVSSDNTNASTHAPFQQMWYDNNVNRFRAEQQSIRAQMPQILSDDKKEYRSMVEELRPS